MSNKKIHKLFPTPIFETKVDDYEKLNLDLEKYIYKLREKDKNGLKLSNAICSKDKRLLMQQIILLMLL